MKKLTFIFILFMASGFAFGQFSIGPKIGFNTSKLTSNQDSITTDLTNNFNFGVFVRLGKKIYLQPEINWLTRGGVFKKPALGDIKPIKQTVEMKSIEIPVIVGWRIINLGVGNIRILAGPSATIVTSKNLSTSDGTSFIAPIKDADIQDLTWGFNMGAGADILMFTIDIRYQMGLNDVVKNVEGFDLNSKSNMFAVSLGWKIL